MSEGEVKFEVGLTITKALDEIQIIERALNQVYTILQKLGLPPNMERAVSGIRRMIVQVNNLKLALIALQAAMAGTPFGWALFGFAAVTAGISLADNVGMYG